MVSEKRLHIKKHEHTRIAFVSPDYEDAMRDCAFDDRYSCAWTMSAAASVINTRVVSVYPSVNGQLDRTLPILNTAFTPAKSTSCGAARHDHRQASGSQTILYRCCGQKNPTTWTCALQRMRTSQVASLRHLRQLNRFVQSLSV